MDRVQASSIRAYYAGLYYLQEPSAMTPGELLPVKPGRPGVDPCAAPGGKSTSWEPDFGGRTAGVQRYQQFPGQGAALRIWSRPGIPNIA